MKQVALSVMIISGDPNRANDDWSSLITQVDDVDEVTAASIHLQWASIKIKKISPKKEQQNLDVI